MWVPKAVIWVAVSTSNRSDFGVNLSANQTWLKNETLVSNFVIVTKAVAVKQQHAERSETGRSRAGILQTQTQTQTQAVTQLVEKYP